MQSKTSYSKKIINKTLFLKNLTRFWPFALIYAVINIVSHPVALYLRINATHRADFTMIERQEWINSFYGGIFIFDAIMIFIFALVAAMAVNSYLYQSRSAYMMHAFPVTRTEMYVSDYLAGLLMLLVPQFITALLTNFVLLGYVNSGIVLVWQWFGTCVVYSLLFFSFANFVSMFTGQLAAVPFFYAIWNFVYYVVVFLTEGVASVFVYGLSGSLISHWMTPLSPLPYLISLMRTSWRGGSTVKFITAGGVAYALVLAVAFTVAAWFTYQKRHIEGAGDFITVGWAKPLFRWCVAVIGAFTGALFMVFLIGNADYMSNTNQMIGKFFIYLIICGISFFIVAEMFIEKSFKVIRKKVLTEAGICVAVMLVFCGMLQFDIFGIESYVPQAEEVKAVRMDAEGITTWKDVEDIERIEELHRGILACRKELKRADRNTVHTNVWYVSLNYYMKNGKNVSRYYGIPEDMLTTGQLQGVYDKMVAMSREPEANLRAYFGLNYDEMDWQVTDATLHYTMRDTLDWTGTDIMDTKENMQKLYTAAVQDIREGHTAYALTSDLGLEELDAELYLVMQSKAYSDDAEDYGMLGDIYQTENGIGCSAYIRLTKQCTHMLDVLMELGVIESVDDIHNNVYE